MDFSQDRWHFLRLIGPLVLSVVLLLVSLSVCAAWLGLSLVGGSPRPSPGPRITIAERASCVN